MRFSRVFDMTRDAAARTGQFVSSCGGTRSGKTISILQFLFLLVSQDVTPTVNSVVSQTYPHLEKGAIRDFKTILGDMFEESCWSESKHIYTFPSGAIIEFFSVDQDARVHGPARDRLFINEAQTLKWDTVLQLLVRTKGLVFIDYNPTHEFWCNTEIETLPDCIRIHSTYLDNVDRETGQSFLSQEQIRIIESRRKSAAWWRVYGEGKTGKLEGLVYPDFELIDAMPKNEGQFIELYGLDFGYSNDPSTLIRVLADTKRKILYLDELLYERGLMNHDLVQKFKVLGVPRSAKIIADAAEPKSCAEIRFGGFGNCRECYKGREVVEQIQFVKGWELHVTKASLNLIRELRNYTWAEDRDGRMLNVPDKGKHFDHALDALRYAVFTELGTFRRSWSKPKTASAW